MPAEHGAQITFSCVSGYNNFGGGTANCNDGQLDSIDGDPQCFGIIHYSQFLFNLVGLTNVCLDVTVSLKATQTRAIPCQLLLNQLISSASCKDESIIWDHVQVDPWLPAEHGAQITFSCVSGYNNFGGGTANCNDGQLVPIHGNPECFGIIHYHQFFIQFSSACKVMSYWPLYFPILT